MYTQKVEQITNQNHRTMYYEEQKRDWQGTILTILIGIVISLGIVFALVNGVKIKEINECRKWKRQAEEYPNFYLTSWQAEQCLFRKVEINAPIK